MTTRRTFMTTTATAAGLAMFAGSAGASDRGAGAPPAKGDPSALPQNPETKRFRPKQKLGMGGVQIGNGFFVTSDEQAYATLQAAWDAGVRYFDTSPWYGLGISERRMGQFLDDKDPDSYVISTKIGRLLVPDASANDIGLWKGRLNFDYRFDYTADATRRSVEDSLQRLGLPKIDIVFVHDLSPDHDEPLGGWEKRFETARTGAMPALTKMRDEGTIKAWGMGVNDIEPCLRALDVADPDVLLSATRYHLVDHEDALTRLFPKCRAKGVSIIVGAPLAAGFLAGKDRYLYGEGIPPTMAKKREALRRVAGAHGVDLRTAALQFTAAPDVVAATIPGPRDPRQVRENVASMKVKIPPAFWAQLEAEGLIAKGAPTPS